VEDLKIFGSVGGSSNEFMKLNELNLMHACSITPSDINKRKSIYRYLKRSNKKQLIPPLHLKIKKII